MAIVEKHFKVAGVSHYIDDFYDELSYPNDLYNSTGSELIESFDEYEKVFQYDFHNANTELRPEPDNQYDPNAVAIFVSGHKIGYVKKGSCSQVKNLISSPEFKKAWVFINGGKYKSAHTDENGHVCVVKGECEYFADLYIQIDDGKPAEQAFNYPLDSPTGRTATNQQKKRESNIGSKVLIGVGAFFSIFGFKDMFYDFRFVSILIIGIALIYLGVRISKK